MTKEEVINLCKSNIVINKMFNKFIKEHPVFSYKGYWKNIIEMVEMNHFNKPIEEGYIKYKFNNKVYTFNYYEQLI